MTTRAFGPWMVPVVTIARTYLAMTLLLSAYAGWSHLSLYTGVIWMGELLLGTTIAAGWLMRYAAVCVLLGTMLTCTLVDHPWVGFIPASTGSIVAVLLASGILAFRGYDTETLISTLAEDNKMPGASCGRMDLEHVEVTIRLEESSGHDLRSGRCVVTVYEESAVIARKTGQEAW